jgi:hypothetical protein
MFGAISRRWCEQATESSSWSLGLGLWALTANAFLDPRVIDFKIQDQSPKAKDPRPILTTDNLVHEFRNQFNNDRRRRAGGPILRCQARFSAGHSPGPRWSNADHLARGRGVLVVEHEIDNSTTAGQTAPSTHKACIFLLTAGLYGN